MITTPRSAAALACALLLSTATACGGSAERSADEEGADGGRGAMRAAADLSTCRADATAAPTPYGDGFPTDWPFPPRTVVFHAEHRKGDATIVTAVSSTGFKDVLAFMNRRVDGAGFATQKGETEEHDAEAEWRGNGFHGRWAIRESASCSGETVIQVLSAAS